MKTSYVFMRRNGEPSANHDFKSYMWFYFHIFCRHSMGIITLSVWQPFCRDGLSYSEAIFLCRGNEHQKHTAISITHKILSYYLRDSEQLLSACRCHSHATRQRPACTKRKKRRGNNQQWRHWQWAQMGSLPSEMKAGLMAMDGERVWFVSFLSRKEDGSGWNQVEICHLQPSPTRQIANCNIEAILLEVLLAAIALKKGEKRQAWGVISAFSVYRTRHALVTFSIITK